MIKNALRKQHAKVAIWPLFFYTPLMKLELFYYKQCPFCARVLRKIDELDLRDHIEFKDTLENRDYAKLHYNNTKRSTVPCLYIDGKAMFESSDINVWLENNIKRIKE